MIVKNEALTIKTCIASLSPQITHYAIVDTGSTDGTQEIIRETMESLGIPGKLIEREWTDFSTARNQSLELAESICPDGWAFVMDADDIWQPATSKLINPVSDINMVKIKLGNTTYTRSLIFKLSLKLRFKGILHEYLDTTGHNSIGQIKEGIIDAAVSSVKRGNWENPQAKYLADAARFEEEIDKMVPEEDLLLWTRYIFYCAQSYRDANSLEKAIKWYGIRATAGGWDQEVWYSLYMIARALDVLGRKEEALSAYLRAWEARPTRLEAPYHLIQMLLGMGRVFLAHQISVAAAKITSNSDILFVENDIWDWKWAFQWSILAYKSGDPTTAKKTLESIIKGRNWWLLDDDVKNACKKNYELFKKSQTLRKKEKGIVKK
jgi:glycosyltransferase involved in cell wall biosynthesis